MSELSSTGGSRPAETKRSPRAATLDETHSAARLEAVYTSGEKGRSALPVEAQTTWGTPAASAASSTLRVPRTLVDTVRCTSTSARAGSRCAATWKITSGCTSRISASSAPRSRTSACRYSAVGWAGPPPAARPPPRAGAADVGLPVLRGGLGWPPTGAPAARADQPGGPALRHLGHHRGADASRPSGDEHRGSGQPRGHLRLWQAEPALADAQEPCVILRGPFPDFDECLRELPQPGENCLVEHSLPGRRDRTHAADDLPDGLQAVDLR